MADALLGGIVINEILADPNGALNFDTDGNGTANSTDEYIELYNTSSSAIDISGLELWDGGVGQWFTFPPGTILQAGGHAMVMSGVQTGGSLPTGAPNDLFFDAGRAAPLINNTGDNVIVYDPSNDEYIAAYYNGDALDDPTLGAGGYSGFSGTATQQGTGEDFGNDTDGQSLQRTGDGTDTFGSDAPTPGITNVCFADGTLILTKSGQRKIETLRTGDLVETADHGLKPIAWIHHKRWTADDIRQRANLAPVLIRQGALGLNLPHQDLRVSQHHRILIQGPIARRMFQAHEVLIAAKHLTALDGISIDLAPIGVTYFHVMFDEHEVILANGAWAESFYLGAQALKSIPHSARREIAEILARPLHELIATPPPTARALATGKKARRLVARHQQNGKSLLHAPTPSPAP